MKKIKLKIDVEVGGAKGSFTFETDEWKWSQLRDHEKRRFAEYAAKIMSVVEFKELS